MRLYDRIFTRRRAKVLARLPLRASAVLALALAAACGDGGTNSGSNPAPAIASLSPDSVMRGAAEATVVVTGSNFTQQSVVRLDGDALQTQFVSAGELRARLGAADLAAGAAARVTVFNPAPGGGESGAAELVVANPVPEFTAVSVSRLEVGGAGAEVTVTGKNFFPETIVWGTEGAMRQYRVTYVSSAELRVALTAEHLKEPGPIVLWISNPEPGGGSTSSGILEIANPVPAITALAPASVATRTAATVTITGSGFLRGSMVRMGGALRQPVFVSATQLQVGLLATDAEISGTMSFRVENPAPGGGTSNEVQMEVRAPVPVLTSLLDSSVRAGQASFVVYVNGTGFVANSEVRFNGEPRPTVANALTQVHATLTAADLATPGTYPITVFNRAPGGGLSNAVSLLVTNPIPTLTSLSPTFVPTGTDGATVTLRGTGFVPGSQGLAEGAARPTTYVSATELRVALTAADVAPAGGILLGVRNPAPGGGSSEERVLGLHAPVPVVTSLSPAQVPDGLPSLTLRVNGTGFASNSVVRLDLSPRTTRAVSSTQLEVLIGPSDLVWARMLPVSVATDGPAGGISNSVDLEIRAPAPVITSLAETQTVAGQTSYFLRINGTGFRATSRARLNGEERLSSPLGATLMEVILTEADLQAPGSFDVTIATPAPGGGVSNAIQFQVVAAARRAP